MSEGKSRETPERLLREEGLEDEDALSAAREETITVLSECFARDLLTVEDFERRAELVHGARSMAELGTAIEGIRTGGLPARTGGTAAGSLRRPRPGPAAAPNLAHAPSARDYDRAIAIFGETKREGAWTPARSNTVVAAMGSAVIDLREAYLDPHRTVVSAFAFMGGVEVIVPPGVHVECSGSAIFGGFEQRKEYMSSPVDPGAPVVQVSGFAVFGGVEIEQRLVGETRREAKRRRRREKKELKRLRKRR